MPWCALPFSERTKEKELSKKFKVNGIPSLVVLDEDGSLITLDGRSKVTEDPTGQSFPWRTAKGAGTADHTALQIDAGPRRARRTGGSQGGGEGGMCKLLCAGVCLLAIIVGFTCIPAIYGLVVVHREEHNWTW